MFLIPLGGPVPFDYYARLLGTSIIADLAESRVVSVPQSTGLMPEVFLALTVALS